MKSTVGCLTFLGVSFLGTLGGWVLGVFISLQIGNIVYQPFQTGTLGGLIGAAVALAMVYRKMKRLDRAGMVLSGSCMVAPILAWLFAYLLPLGSPKPFEQAAFDHVVAEIEGGVLRPDRHGVVRLSGEFASLSATRRVYVRRWPSGRLIVFVPSWVGRNTALINIAAMSGDSWLEGYIYDSVQESHKHSGTKVTADDYPDVLGPPPEPPWGAAHDARAQLRPGVEPRMQIDEHWSYADIFS